METLQKTVLITGANAGLGFACARETANICPACAIVIAGRNPGRIAQAAQKLSAEIPTAQFVPMLLDLASLASVRKFAEDLLASGLPPISALVCNAGIRPTKKIEVTADGYEAVFGVNYLGHFLLTRLLLPHMPESSRFIFVSSRVHDYRDVSPFPKPVYQNPALLADPHAPKGVSEHSFCAQAYSNSKLCATMYGFELARRLQAEGRGIQSIVFDPGAVPTDIIRDYGPFVKGAMRFVWPVARLLPNMSSVSASAHAMAELAVSEEYNGVTGKYYSMIGSYQKGAKEADPSPLAFDPDKTKELWEGSEKLVSI